MLFGGVLAVCALFGRSFLRVQGFVIGFQHSLFPFQPHVNVLCRYRFKVGGDTNTGKKRAGQFSLGMKQRLGIAIALLNSPQLLILDEPTNGLDPLGIEELRELIRSFPSNGITVILSSHILSEVQQIADHVGIIAGGVLGYEGELRAGEDLEQLFMDVIRRNDKEGY